MPEQAAEQLAEFAEFLLVAYTHSVALGQVKVAGILVCRMREEVEPELAFRVELDLDVEVSYHI